MRAPKLWEQVVVFGVGMAVGRGVVWIAERFDNRPVKDVEDDGNGYLASGPEDVSGRVDVDKIPDYLLELLGLSRDDVAQIKKELGW